MPAYTNRRLSGIFGLLRLSPSQSFVLLRVFYTILGGKSRPPLAARGDFFRKNPPWTPKNLPPLPFLSAYGSVGDIVCAALGFFTVRFFVFLELGIVVPFQVGDAGAVFFGWFEGWA